jgi:hypothetical protein
MTFSETVDYLQGDVDKGAELLIDIAKEQEQALLKIKEAEKELQKANDNYYATMAAIENVCKYLKKYPHFHITKDKKDYHFTPEFQVHISDIDWEL